MFSVYLHKKINTIYVQVVHYTLMNYHISHTLNCFTICKLFSDLNLHRHHNHSFKNRNTVCYSIFNSNYVFTLTKKKQHIRICCAFLVTKLCILRQLVAKMIEKQKNKYYLAYVINECNLLFFSEPEHLSSFCSLLIAFVCVLYKTAF